MTSRAFTATGFLLAAALLAGAAGGQGQPPSPPPSPAAESKVVAEVMVLHATNDKSGIDPRIGPLPELSEPPFSSFNSYRLLDLVKLDLVKGSPSSTKLPNERTFQVTLVEVRDKKRFRLATRIQNADGKDFLPRVEMIAEPNRTFFVAGQSFKGGKIFVGVKLLP